MKSMKRIILMAAVCLLVLAVGCSSSRTGDVSDESDVQNSTVSGTSGEVSGEISGTGDVSDPEGTFNWATNRYTAGIPAYEDGVFYADSGNAIADGVLLIYRQTSREAYDAYRDTLMAAGFEQDYHTSEKSNEQYIYADAYSYVYMMYQTDLGQVQIKVYPVEDAPPRPVSAVSEPSPSYLPE